MPTGNTTTTPKVGTTHVQTKIGKMLAAAKRPSGQRDPLARQQAIENHLSAALYHVRHSTSTNELQSAVGRAIRAASLLKQACNDGEVAHG